MDSLVDGLAGALAHIPLGRRKRQTSSTMHGQAIRWLWGWLGKQLEDWEEKKYYQESSVSSLNYKGKQETVQTFIRPSHLIHPNLIYLLYWIFGAVLTLLVVLAILTILAVNFVLAVLVAETLMAVLAVLAVMTVMAALAVLALLAGLAV